LRSNGDRPPTDGDLQIQDLLIGLYILVLAPRK
jgi:hypothetical protein